MKATVAILVIVVAFLVLVTMVQDVELDAMESQKNQDHAWLILHQNDLQKQRSDIRRLEYQLARANETTDSLRAVISSDNGSLVNALSALQQSLENELTTLTTLNSALAAEIDSLRKDINVNSGLISILEQQERKNSDVIHILVGETAFFKGLLLMHAKQEKGLFPKPHDEKLKSKLRLDKKIWERIEELSEE
ncbi:hypothetical protein MYX06_03870 [Patescibacteria group bacterium AH-259-L05]|nr:hypothetical protein [Patescibacteria group bacterium AH-259-L05]